MHPLPSSTVLAALADALTASLWQGTSLVLLVALGLHRLPALTSAARSAIWAATLFLIALLPFLALTGHHSGIPSTGLLHVETGFSLAFVALWGLASMVRAVQLAVGAFELWRILRAARPLAPAPGIAALLRQAPRRPRLCVSATVNRPSVAGFFRPRLLLPAALLPELNEAELTQIVLHELEHLRRGDDWIHLAQQLALLLLPLHPALLWLNGRLALERELACDDAVIATTRAGRAYAACLAHVAEQSLLQRGVSLALGALGSSLGPRRRAELTTRVERLLHRPERPLRGRPLHFATGLVLAGTAASAALLAHSPRLVSFDRVATSDTAAVSAPLPDSQMLPGSQMLPVHQMLPVLQRVPTVQSFPQSHTPMRAMLLKATLPTSTAASTAASPLASRRHLAVTMGTVLRPRARTLTLRRVVLADRPRSISYVAAPEAPQFVPIFFIPRLAPILEPTQRTWYTAVPWRNGWLVVQL